MKGLAAAVACAGMLALPASSTAIVNGSVDGNAHPNVGALTVSSAGVQVLACTGTLISPTVLVTAAHCTAQLQQLGYTQTQVSFDSDIGFGSDVTCALVDCVVDPAPGSLHLGTIHTHPAFSLTAGSSYGNGVDSHDVAVVTFDQPVTGIAPASLPSAGLLSSKAFASRTFTDVGYGWHAIATKGGRNPTGLLDGVRRFAVGGSQALTTSDVKITENAALGYGGACDHDSGGPAFVGASDVIAGEVSNLQGNCNNTYYAYRLDTASARAFLGQYVTLP